MIKLVYIYINKSIGHIRVNFFKLYIYIIPKREWNNLEIKLIMYSVYINEK